MQYARAATRLVASDRLPICMTEPIQNNDTEEVQNKGTTEGEGGIKLWSLNVRGVSTKESLDELEQEAGGMRTRLIIGTGTWRLEATEKLNIGNWTFYRTGNNETPGETGQGSWCTTP